AAPPRPTLAARLREFLAPEIAQGLVTVTGDVQRTLVRIKGSGIYASGSATLNDRFAPLLARIGQAIAEEDASRTQILGHSDNQPIRTVRFPSNFHLSQARAEAALEEIRRASALDAARFTAEGRGESEPVADNRTAEGREANRRIEVLVLNRREN
ncbi:type VI secretion system protein TssL, long form, partial [Roseomonas sp. 18066]|uniref:type VI secretion system protein TssL, long form n=1 Tax=Roseomonas sp. 18066 TaxID=2681412 RepID=UPI0013595E65